MSARSLSLLGASSPSWSALGGSPQRRRRPQVERQQEEDVDEGLLSDPMETPTAINENNKRELGQISISPKDTTRSIDDHSDTQPPTSPSPSSSTALSASGPLSASSPSLTRIKLRTDTREFANHAAMIESQAVALERLMLELNEFNSVTRVAPSAAASTDTEFLQTQLAARDRDLFELLAKNAQQADELHIRAQTIATLEMTVKDLEKRLSDATAAATPPTQTHQPRYTDADTNTHSVDDDESDSSVALHQRRRAPKQPTPAPSPQQQLAPPAADSAPGSPRRRSPSKIPRPSSSISSSPLSTPSRAQSTPRQQSKAARESKLPRLSPQAQATYQPHISIQMHAPDSSHSATPSRLEELLHENGDLIRRLTSRDQEFTDLHDKYTSAINELEQLQAQVDSMPSSIAGQPNHSPSMNLASPTTVLMQQQEIEMLRAALEQAHQQQQQQQQQQPEPSTIDHSNDAEEWYQQIEYLTNENLRLQSELDSQHTAHARELESQLMKFAADRSLLLSELESRHAAQIRLVDSELTDLRRSNATLLAEVESLHSAQIESDHRNLLGEVERLQRDNAYLLSELDSLHASHAADLTAQEARSKVDIDKIEETHSKLQQNILKQKKVAAEQDTQLAQLRLKMAQKDAIVLQLESQVAQLTHKSDSTQTKLKEASTARQQVLTEYAKLVDDMRSVYQAIRRVQRAAARDRQRGDQTRQIDAAPATSASAVTPAANLSMLLPSIDEHPVERASTPNRSQRGSGNPFDDGSGGPSTPVPPAESVTDGDDNPDTDESGVTSDDCIRLLDSLHSDLASLRVDKDRLHQQLLLLSTKPVVARTSLLSTPARHQHMADISMLFPQLPHATPNVQHHHNMSSSVGRGPLSPFDGDDVDGDGKVTPFDQTPFDRLLNDSDIQIASPVFGAHPSPSVFDLSHDSAAASPSHAASLVLSHHRLSSDLRSKESECVDLRRTLAASQAEVQQLQKLLVDATHSPSSASASPAPDSNATAALATELEREKLTRIMLEKDLTKREEAFDTIQRELNQERQQGYIRSLELEQRLQEERNKVLQMELELDELARSLEKRTQNDAPDTIIEEDANGRTPTTPVRSNSSAPAASLEPQVQPPPAGLLTPHTVKIRAIYAKEMKKYKDDIRKMQQQHTTTAKATSVSQAQSQQQPQSKKPPPLVLSSPSTPAPLTASAGGVSDDPTSVSASSSSSTSNDPLVLRRCIQELSIEKLIFQSQFLGLSDLLKKRESTWLTERRTLEIEIDQRIKEIKEDKCEIQKLQQEVYSVKLKNSLMQQQLKRNTNVTQTASVTAPKANDPTSAHHVHTPPSSSNSRDLLQTPSPIRARPPAPLTVSTDGGVITGGDELNHLSSQLLSLDSLNSSLRAELSSLTSSNASLDSSLRQTQQHLTQVLEDLHGALNMVDRLEAELRSERHKLTDLRRSSEEQEMAAREERRKLLEQIEYLETCLATQQAIVEEMRIRRAETAADADATNTGEGVGVGVGSLELGEDLLECEVEVASPSTSEAVAQRQRSAAERHRARQIHARKEEVTNTATTTSSNTITPSPRASPHTRSRSTSNSRTASPSSRRYSQSHATSPSHKKLATPNSRSVSMPSESPTAPSGSLLYAHAAKEQQVSMLQSRLAELEGELHHLRVTSSSKEIDAASQIDQLRSHVRDLEADVSHCRLHHGPSEVHASIESIERHSHFKTKVRTMEEEFVKALQTQLETHCEFRRDEEKRRMKFEQQVKLDRSECIEQLKKKDQELIKLQETINKLETQRTHNNTNMMNTATNTESMTMANFTFTKLTGMTSGSPSKGGLTHSAPLPGVGVSPNVRAYTVPANEAAARAKQATQLTESQIAEAVASASDAARRHFGPLIHSMQQDKYLLEQAILQHISSLNGLERYSLQLEQKIVQLEQLLRAHGLSPTNSLEQVEQTMPPTPTITPATSYAAAERQHATVSNQPLKWPVPPVPIQPGQFHLNMSSAMHTPMRRATGAGGVLNGPSPTPAPAPTPSSMPLGSSLVSTPIRPSGVDAASSLAASSSSSASIAAGGVSTMTYLQQTMLQLQQQRQQAARARSINTPGRNTQHTTTTTTTTTTPSMRTPISAAASTTSPSPHPLVTPFSAASPASGTASPIHPFARSVASELHARLDTAESEFQAAIAKANRDAAARRQNETPPKENQQANQTQTKRQQEEMKKAQTTTTPTTKADPGVQAKSGTTGESHHQELTRAVARRRVVLDRQMPSTPLSPASVAAAIAALSPPKPLNHIVPSNTRIKSNPPLSLPVAKSIAASSAAATRGTIPPGTIQITIEESEEVTIEELTLADLDGGSSDHDTKHAGEVSAIEDIAISDGEIDDDALDALLDSPSSTTRTRSITSPNLNQSTRVASTVSVASPASSRSTQPTSILRSSLRSSPSVPASATPVGGTAAASSASTRPAPQGDLTRPMRSAIKPPLPVKIRSPNTNPTAPQPLATSPAVAPSPSPKRVTFQQTHARKQ